jgi:hypothetical protein
MYPSTSFSIMTKTVNPAGSSGSETIVPRLPKKKNIHYHVENQRVACRRGTV